ncbi:MAG: hypothetical protein ABSB23_04725 [Bryobacteraceae bacterium]|jgi:hypothetical protein
MAKFKPPRGKRTSKVVPQGAVPCVIIIIGGILLLMLFVYFVLRGSAQ